jgi:adenylate cyclase
MVDKYLGDGVLAQFLDGPAECQAEDALAAALDLQQRILAWNYARQVKRLPPLRVTVALHAGPVLAGVFDDGLRAEFTVLGPAMNALSRIERRTKEPDCGLLASKRFARLLPPASRQDLRITRLVRRADEADAPDIVKIEVLERSSTSRVTTAIMA